MVLIADAYGSLAGGSPVPSRGLVLDASRIEGVHQGFSAGLGPGTHQIYRDNTNTLPLQLTYTPPVDVWTRIKHNNGGIAITAGSGFTYAQVAISPAPTVGPPYFLAITSSYTGVRAYRQRSLVGLARLNAGVTYTIKAEVQIGTGTWVYYKSNEYINLSIVSWAR